MRLRPSKPLLLRRLTQRPVMWAAIKGLAAGGEFCVRDVMGRTEITRVGIIHALHQLVAAGLLTARIEGLRTIYRAAAELPDTMPRLTKAGRDRGTSGNDRIWAAMKPLPDFTRAELAACATVSEAQAGRYLRHLQRAGYLAIVAHGHAGVRTRYRLLPAMNTGPIAPSVRTGGVVFDHNRNTDVPPVAAGGVP